MRKATLANTAAQKQIIGRASLVFPFAGASRRLSK
jgi:hypothetical protein